MNRNIYQLVFILYTSICILMKWIEYVNKQVFFLCLNTCTAHKLLFFFCDVADVMYIVTKKIPHFCNVECLCFSWNLGFFLLYYSVEFRVNFIDRNLFEQLLKSFPFLNILLPSHSCAILIRWKMYHQQVASISVTLIYVQVNKHITFFSFFSWFAILLFYI